MSTSLMPVDDGRVIDRGMLPVADVVARTRRIQEVMAALMKEGTHYGKIPGTDKPTLYKPGAELILSTFRVAAVVAHTDDLSTEDEIRYRVTVRGVNQATGEILGEMMGECSSSEEKYRWRRPVCDEEWQAAPEDRRREKWAKGREGPYRIKQIRTSPADVANTVLKMAVKRALIAMTLVVTAASDCFAQDLEDLPEEVREAVAEEQGGTHHAPIAPPQRKPVAQAAPAPAPRPATNGHTAPSGAVISEKQAARFHAIARDGGWQEQELRQLLESWGFADSAQITRDKYEALIDIVRGGSDAGA